MSTWQQTRSPAIVKIVALSARIASSRGCRSPAHQYRPSSGARVWRAFVPGTRLQSLLVAMQLHQLRLRQDLALHGLL